MMMTACVSFQGLKAHLYCVVGDDDAACVSFQGLKAHLYCVVGDDADCLCVISRQWHISKGFLRAATGQ